MQKDKSKGTIFQFAFHLCGKPRSLTFKSKHSYVLVRISSLGYQDYNGDFKTGFVMAVLPSLGRDSTASQTKEPLILAPVGQSSYWAASLHGLQWKSQQERGYKSLRPQHVPQNRSIGK